MDLSVFLTVPSPAGRYGMRFISKVLKDSLHEKFPDATEEELLKVCIQTDGGLVELLTTFSWRSCSCFLSL